MMLWIDGITAIENYYNSRPDIRCKMMIKQIEENGILLIILSWNKI